MPQRVSVIMCTTNGEKGEGVGSYGRIEKSELGMGVCVMP